MSTRGKQLLALVCRVCPVCVLRRRWPQTRFSRALRWLERGCPFCRAHAQVRAVHTTAHHAPTH